MIWLVMAPLGASALVVLYIALRELASWLRGRRMRRQDGRAIEVFLEHELRVQRATRDFYEEQRQAAGRHQ